MRSTIRTRVAAVAVSIPLALVALSACGSSSSNPSTASDATSTASTPTTDPSTDSSPSGSGSTSAAADGQLIPTQQFLDEVQASYDHITTAHMTLNMTVGGSTIAAKGEVDYTGDSPKMAMTMSDPTGSGKGNMEMRLFGTVIYMKIPGASQGKFFKLDMNDPNSPLGDLSSLTDSMDPKHALDQFAPAVKQVKFLGNESVDGENMNHYRVTMDPSKVKSLGQLGSTAQLPGTLSYDMWLDGSHRMRQFTMDMSGMKMEMKYFAWDQPVDIQEPPASQVTTFPGA